MSHDTPPSPSRAADGPQPQTPRLNRRALLAGAGAAAAGVGTLAWYGGNENGWRAEVAIAHAPRYDAGLVHRIRDVLRAIRINRSQVAQKRVLLKPNLVEPSAEAPHINTHPLFVRAVAEVLMRWDAAEVIVAEGQGHIRDSWYVLEQSGLESVLDETRIQFVDLNHDHVFAAKNAGRWMKERTLYLPQTLRQVDWVVSLPKLKTHHWAGATLSMKNLFGCMPGICYGWPKNVLHYNGIPNSIVDITATVRPQLAIVDGIVGMQGDGPIMGDPYPSQLVIAGTNLPAVDATCCRVMGIDPWRVPYLRMASGSLGPIAQSHIQQRGERLEDCRHAFHVLDDVGLLPAGARLPIRPGAAPSS